MARRGSLRKCRGWTHAAIALSRRGARPFRRQQIGTEMTEDVTDLLALALAELRAAHTAQGKALTTLETAFKQALEGRLDRLALCDAPPSEHRRAHRPGVQRRIDTEPELETFIRARVDRMTFAELAAEVANVFPPNRRVGRSAIHDWWKCHQKAQSRAVQRR